VAITLQYALNLHHIYDNLFCQQDYYANSLQSCGRVSGCINARKYGGVVQADAKAWGLQGPMLIQRG